MATLKNGVASNQFYRVYEVKPCQQLDYILYIAHFKTVYAGKTLHMNLHAMSGVMLFINEDSEKPEQESQTEDSSNAVEN